MKTIVDVFTSVDFSYAEKEGFFAISFDPRELTHEELGIVKHHANRFLPYSSWGGTAVLKDLSDADYLLLKMTGNETDRDSVDIGIMTFYSHYDWFSQ